MMYCMLYAISKGLTVTTTAMMCKRALHLGGIHVDQLFKLPFNGDKMDAHRRAEMAIIKLLSKPTKLDFLRSVDIIFFDEMGQVSSLLLSMLDMILRKVRHSNIYMGGVLLIFSMDHTQIQPIDGRPFLTSSNIVSCFKMVCLEHSVRAHNDPEFQRIQQISRFPHSKFDEDPSLVDEFINLCSEHLTFVDDWDDERITPTTMRLYSKKVPARESSRLFVAGAMRDIAECDRITRLADDVEKFRHSNAEWIPARDKTVAALEQKVKEPKELLFFRGAVFEITFNSEGKFSNTQLALLYELPLRQDLADWKRIKVLKAPDGCKSIEYHPDTPKQVYLDNKYEEVSIGVCPDRTQFMSFETQAKRKQYGLKHHVTSTIHAAMGDTLQSMATKISSRNMKYAMWDKGQMIVILSQTTLAVNSIFVGDKNETLQTLKQLLTRKTQWTDYMEMILDLITVYENEEEGRTPRNVMHTDTFPYRICDMSLPQCNTGYVYMLISLVDQSFVYIGMTTCIRKRVQQHNSGVGAVSTEPLHLRPYALFAYICGFDLRKDLMSYVEHAWKVKRDHLVRDGVNSPMAWAQVGAQIVTEFDQEETSDPCGLSLVCMFKE